MLELLAAIASSSHGLRQHRRRVVTRSAISPHEVTAKGAIFQNVVGPGRRTPGLLRPERRDPKCGFWPKGRPSGRTQPACSVNWAGRPVRSNSHFAPSASRAGLELGQIECRPVHLRGRKRRCQGQARPAHPRVVGAKATAVVVALGPAPPSPSHPGVHLLAGRGRARAAGPGPSHDE